MPNYLDNENVLFALVVSLIQNNDELKKKALELINQMSTKEFFGATLKREWKSFHGIYFGITTDQIDKLILENMK